MTFLSMLAPVADDMRRLDTLIGERLESDVPLVRQVAKYIVAAGGKICVGDQLHPRGVLDKAVYRLLGHSFDRIERLEPWLEGAAPSAEIAILALGQSGDSAPGVGAHSPDVEGAAQFLLEAGLQFDIVDGESDLARYDARVVELFPDEEFLSWAHNGVAGGEWRHQPG